MSDLSQHWLRVDADLGLPAASFAISARDIILHSGDFIPVLTAIKEQRIEDAARQAEAVVAKFRPELAGCVAFGIEMREFHALILVAHHSLKRIGSGALFEKLPLIPPEESVSADHKVPSVR